MGMKGDANLIVWKVLGKPESIEGQGAREQQSMEGEDKKRFGLAQKLVWFAHPPLFCQAAITYARVVAVIEVASKLAQDGWKFAALACAAVIVTLHHTLTPRV